MADRAWVALTDRHYATQLNEGNRVAEAINEAWSRTMTARDFEKGFDEFARLAIPAIQAGFLNSAQIGADYYAEARKAAGLGTAGEVRPRVKPLSADDLRKHLYESAVKEAKKARQTKKGATPEQALEKARIATMSTARHWTLAGGRATVTNAAMRDRSAVAWCRISDGAPCAFCAMLVGRGPVYRSEATADFPAHTRCGCAVGIVFRGQDGWTDEARAFEKVYNDYPQRTQYNKDGSVKRESYRAAYERMKKDPDSHVGRALADMRERRAGLERQALADRIGDIRARLPEDRSMLGKRKVRLSLEESRETALRRLYDDYGTTDYLRERSGEIDRLVDATQRLRVELAQMADDGFTSRAWPAHLKSLAADAGVTHGSPRAVWAAIDERIASLETTRAEITDARMFVLMEERRINGPDFKAIESVVDDIDDAGFLGADTQRALEAVLDAGRVVDDEVMARAAAMSPGAQEAAEKAQRAYKAAEDAWHAETDPLRRDVLLEEAWEALDEMRKREGVWAEAQRRATLDVLGEVREMGGGKRPKYQTLRDAATREHAAELRERMEAAHTRYPSEWNDRVTDFSPEMDLLFADRGENGFSLERGRYYIQVSDDWRVSQKVSQSTATHELGHSMEKAVPGLRAMEMAFNYSRAYKRRFPDGRQALRDPLDIYGDGMEWAWEDDWPSAYSGKTYFSADDDEPWADNCWEVFTTGMEGLMENGGRGFLRGTRKRWAADGSFTTVEPDSDADFRRFILGVLSVL